MNDASSCENRRTAILVIFLLAAPTLILWSEGTPSPCELDRIHPENYRLSFGDTIEDMMEYTSLVEPYQTTLRAQYIVKNIDEEKTISFRWMPMEFEVSFRTGLPPQKVQHWKAPSARYIEDFKLNYEANIHLDQSRSEGPHIAPAYVATDGHLCGGGVEINNSNGSMLAKVDLLYDPFTDRVLVVHRSDAHDYRAAIAYVVFDITDLSVQQALRVSELRKMEDLGEGFLELPIGRYTVPVRWPSDSHIAVPVVLFGPKGTVVSANIAIDRIERRTDGIDSSYSLNGTVAVTNEAPDLETRVATGELPPLEQRLPSDPLIVNPQDRPGIYGGTLRRTWIQPNWWSVVSLMAQNLMRFTPDVSDMIPNLASGFEVNQNSTTFTFYLRKGVHWSDGQEFSAEDLVWWYENILSADDPPPWWWWWLSVAGDFRVEEVDRYTVRFHFTEPYELFSEMLARGTGYSIIQPAHYLKQFHPEFSTDGDRMIKERGYEEWAQFLAYDRILSANVPSLNAWVVSPDSDERLFTMERNAYFWQVDTDGQQLPYIDRVTFNLVSEEEMYLRAWNGEVDFQFGYNPNEFIRFVENEERGGYRTLYYGIRGDLPALGIVNVNLRNVPQHATYHRIRSSPGNFIPEQFFYY